MSSAQDRSLDNTPLFSTQTLGIDLRAGLVVSLVALPLCLGIALASKSTEFEVPPLSGIIAGIVGGIVVGSISGSHTSVSGPAAGLTAIVATQITKCGSLEAFFLAVVIAGVFQIGLGLMKAGAISAFFPSSVIKGLLAAIGIILILKQIPHALGHDEDPEGEMSLHQPDHENTFSELGKLFDGTLHYGAILVVVICLAALILWEKWPVLKKSVIPGPLVVVLLGVVLNQFLLPALGEEWIIGVSHLVKLPVAESASKLVSNLMFPDFTAILNPAVYTAAAMVAVVASLETLLNLEAVDKLDEEKRNSPPNRELIAQGIGNVCSGLLGGLPVTSVVVRGSVNTNMGVKTKVSTLFHGILLVIAVFLLPTYINMIPFSALAAILLYTGFKLASPALFKKMWSEGQSQFAPFVITILAIVMSDLLIGIVIGLIVSVLFILNSNLRQPIRRVLETSADGNVLHVELGNQVSFLNRGALDTLLNEVDPDTKILIDASNSDYIDPDILSMLREFKSTIAPARGIAVTMRGFRKKYQFTDDIEFANHTTREVQDKSTPDQVFDVLKDGNERFFNGKPVKRDLNRQVVATATGQNPLAAILSCIDSRVPAEIVFDVGIGDIFSVRVAGNIVGEHALGSLEYAVAVARVKLVVVLGHTKCGAIHSTVEIVETNQNRDGIPPFLSTIVTEIETVIEQEKKSGSNSHEHDRDEYLHSITCKNVDQTVASILKQSDVIREAVEAGNVKVVGAIYDVSTARITFFDDAET